jgi:DNA invertase Pin-like site-specific DNA recombinase
LEEALSYVRTGGTLVVWRLDRFGRSLRDLIERTNQLHARNIGFKSIMENIDTTTSGGKLVFHIFGALAEFERDLIRERTQAGLTAARGRGSVSMRCCLFWCRQSCVSARVTDGQFGRRNANCSDGEL